MAGIKKHMRSKAGFTLVEAIVVAVIVAVIAAIAIPIYNGFLNDSRQDAVDNLAQTAAAAANIYWRKTNKEPPTPVLHNTAPLNLFFDDTKFSITVSGSNIRVSMKDYTSIYKEVSFK